MILFISATIQQNAAITASPLQVMSLWQESMQIPAIFCPPMYMEPGKVAKDQTHTLNGINTEQLQITATTTETLNTALDPSTRGNTITVSGKFSNPNALVGQRIQTQFADGSGYGLKVLRVNELTDSTVIEVERFNPFKVTATGVETLFYPVGIAIPGNAYVLFKQPNFAADFNRPLRRITPLPDGSTGIRLLF